MADLNGTLKPRCAVCLYWFGVLDNSVPCCDKKAFKLIDGEKEDAVRESPTAKYRDDEAKSILSDASMSMREENFIDDKDKAGRELFECLLLLDGCAYFRIKKVAQDTKVEGTTETLLANIKVTDKADKVRVLYLGVGKFSIAGLAGSPRGQQHEFEFRYNPVTKIMEGTSNDIYYNPAPGEPKMRKRDALAELVDAIVSCLQCRDPEPTA